MSEEEPIFDAAKRIRRVQNDLKALSPLLPPVLKAELRRAVMAVDYLAVPIEKRAAGHYGEWAGLTFPEAGPNQSYADQPRSTPGSSDGS